MFKVGSVVLCIIIYISITNSFCTFSVFCDYGGNEPKVDESQNCTNIEKNTFQQLLLMERADFIRDVSITNCMKEMTPGSFNNIVNLNELYFDDNNFEKISSNSFNSSSLVTLKMLGCKIKTIEGKLGHLPMLLRLVLQNNKLTDFTSQVLSHPENLRNLDLENNKLTILSPEMFMGLKKLNILNLGFNKINFIEPDSFSTMPRLHSLSLTGNSIEILSGNELPRNGFQHFKLLYVGKNRLMFLPLNFLSKLGTNVDIELGENPWHCRCLDNMLRYFKERNISGSNWDQELANRNDVPYCIQPSDAHCDYKYNLPLVHKYLNEIKMRKDRYTLDDRRILFGSGR